MVEGPDDVSLEEPLDHCKEIVYIRIYEHLLRLAPEGYIYTQVLLCSLFWSDNLLSFTKYPLYKIYCVILYIKNTVKGQDHIHQSLR